MTTETWRGRIALMVAHCAGMVDLVALPVWVGALIERYRFSPQQAGMLATLFLLGAVLSSLFFAPRFNRLNARLAAAAGFALAALTFLAASRTSEFAMLAMLHALAGATAACGLSFTHGTIARSLNPHRLFAIVGMALGVFAILFLGVTPNLVAGFGGTALFVVFSGVMAVAALAAALSFPKPVMRSDDDLIAEVSHLPRTVWFGIAGISCMALTQAMLFSFIERIGSDRGFGAEMVTGVLIALGFVNLLPAPLAAVLETRLPARHVLLAGPVCQALIAVTITFGSGFVTYAVPTAIFAAVMIFTHTFAFGLLSRLDPTARALAGTPAMLMIGAAIGPILGGTLVQLFGYPALGLGAVLISSVAVVTFSRVFVARGAASTASLEIA
ncbi:putative permease (MFS superfamily) [Bradyrhizobium sp. STM 3843]|uniref:MFS transporter n=1 Tax=Bradyrhizobium sp. STM 3843 TaxID=551947 RepID=UPI0002403295|nr:MFS transporter [Bradyrhizobium sp. STM 3843]CCE10719.1 putative permease (MFS superfamily) [Bradyrhizobium sp. STM 3843]